MQVTVRHAGGVKFESSARGHIIVSDQPFANGGGDKGMTPPEFLLASLGTCAGYYAAEYLRARNLPLAGLTVTVSAEKAAQPARLGSFRIEVEIPPVDPRHQAGLERAVAACLVHNTLTHSPTVETVVRIAPGVAPAALAA